MNREIDTAKKNPESTNDFGKEYYDWISELSQRYRQSQIKAAVRVNSEMLRFYWTVGKDIEERKLENKYGSHFYENLSRDLSLALNKKSGLSPTSLKYAKYFYCLYSPLLANRQQLVDDLETPTRPQLVDDLEILFRIPWGHHRYIIDKVSAQRVGSAVHCTKKYMEECSIKMSAKMADSKYKC